MLFRSGEAQADTARRHNATVLDEATTVVRVLEAAIRRNADRLLTRDTVARLLETLRASQPAVVEQVVPGVLTVATIHRSLQALLREGVPIRPLAELLEIMADHAADRPDPIQLAETVRRHIARTICRRARDPQGRLPTVRLTAAAIDAILDDPGRRGAASIVEIGRAHV